VTRAARHARVWPPLYRVGRAAVTAWGMALNGFEVAGRGNIPADRGCLVVCNHLADCDGMYVGAALPGLPREVQHLVTGRHHDSSPVVREVLLRVGLEPVRTDGTEMAALRHARRVLQDGGIVVIYPEGVPGYSARVGPFAGGVGWLALTPGIHVVPAAIWGTHRVMRHGLPVARGPVRVAFGPAGTIGGLKGSRAERVVRATARMRHDVQRLVDAVALGGPPA